MQPKAKMDSIERKDREDRQGGGVMVYISNCIQYKRRLDLEKDNLEIIWLETVYKCTRNVIVAMLYRPPNVRVDWFTHISITLIDLLCLENKEISLLGDVNIDLLEYVENGTDVPLHLSDSDRKLKKLIHTFNIYNLHQIVREPTRVSDHSKTLIDHVYTTNPEHIVSTSVPVYSISDHYPFCIYTESHETIKSVIKPY